MKQNYHVRVQNKKKKTERLKSGGAFSASDKASTMRQRDSSKINTVR